jgi:hypothetical protein
MTLMFEGCLTGGGNPTLISPAAPSNSQPRGGSQYQISHHLKQMTVSRVGRNPRARPPTWPAGSQCVMAACFLLVQPTMPRCGLTVDKGGKAPPMSIECCQPFLFQREGRITRSGTLSPVAVCSTTVHLAVAAAGLSGIAFCHRIALPTPRMALRDRDSRVAVSSMSMV